jgi:hypothetical protein
MYNLVSCPIQSSKGDRMNCHKRTLTNNSFIVKKDKKQNWGEMGIGRGRGQLIIIVYNILDDAKRERKGSGQNEDVDGGGRGGGGGRKGRR